MSKDFIIPGEEGETGPIELPLTSVWGGSTHGVKGGDEMPKDEQEPEEKPVSGIGPGLAGLHPFLSSPRVRVVGGAVPPGFGDIMEHIMGSRSTPAKDEPMDGEPSLESHLDELSAVVRAASEGPAEFAPGTRIEAKPGCERIMGTTIPFRRPGFVGVVVQQLAEPHVPYLNSKDPGYVQATFGIRWDTVVAVKDFTDGEVRLIGVDSRFFRVLQD